MTATPTRVATMDVPTYLRRHLVEVGPVAVRLADHQACSALQAADVLHPVAACEHHPQHPAWIHRVTRDACAHPCAWDDRHPACCPARVARQASQPEADPSAVHVSTLQPERKRQVSAMQLLRQEPLAREAPLRQQPPALRVQQPAPLELEPLVFARALA